MATGATHDFHQKGPPVGRGGDPEAVDRLEGRQRTVFMLCHYGDFTPREVSAMTGLNESTVRVHLFRAARKLRGLLGGKP